MNALMEMTNTVEDVEGLLTETFGSPAPPKDEILRHKWLESEKAGRDIGLPAALQDWSVKHYQPWKTAHVVTRRHDLLVGAVMLPLIFLWVVEALTEWWTGFDILTSLFEPLMKLVLPS
jgi:hypothetical protein